MRWLVVALVAGCGADVGHVAELFPDDGSIAKLEIKLEQSAIERLKKRRRKWVEGAVVYQGRVLERVAVKLKGHRSMRKIDEKPAFKLHFSKFVPKRRFFGLTKLTLNNMVEDRTMLREMLGYRVHRALGVRVPKTRYAEVHVNGEYYGLYLMLEPIDDSFLTSRGHAGDSIYEGEYGCDLYPDDVDGFDRDGGEGSREDFRRLTRIAQGSAEGLFHLPRAPIDRRRVVAFLAASALIGDFDGYRQSHNYYLHHDVERDKWALIPWGLDRSFATSMSIFDSGGLLAKKCFGDQLCREQYEEVLRSAVDDFERLDLPSRAKQLDRIIGHSYQTDPRKPYTVIEMKKASLELGVYLKKRPEQIRQELELGRVEKPIEPCAEHSIDGVTFTLCDRAITWEEAAEACASEGRLLAKIDSEKQARFLFRLTQNVRKGRWWIGFNDRRVEDDFRWSDHSPVTFAYWAKGEPDNFVCNQDCAAITETDEGRWHDNHCAHRMPFVCR